MRERNRLTIKKVIYALLFVVLSVVVQHWITKRHAFSAHVASVMSEEETRQCISIVLDDAMDDTAALFKKLGTNYCVLKADTDLILKVEDKLIARIIEDDNFPTGALILKLNNERVTVPLIPQN